MDLRAVPKRSYIQTTNSNHSDPIYSNILKRNFYSEAPDRVWVSDITYIWTLEGWLYLASIMDLFSRRIVGWSIGQTLSKELALQSLDRAIMMRKPTEALIHHSDRGSQYTSKEYIERLNEHDIQVSMSRKGDCFDNACIESFHATIKKELIYRTRFKTREEAKWEVWKYIMMFYNAKRKHSTIGYKSPNQWERSYKEKPISLLA
ncbi:IS3 family transposase [Thalassobacillus sp. CUG 92003]|uniref:IS3 family transposase n=1 Tax=Thalassobacillus sp. CUG 92003 TaxID=2736641 RepID=UPI0015E7D64C|nr:IS3 family transposase [Thalassobacillus sp. CUG 92003]